MNDSTPKPKFTIRCQPNPTDGGCTIRLQILGDGVLLHERETAYIFPSIREADEVLNVIVGAYQEWALALLLAFSEIKLEAEGETEGQQ